MKKVISFFVLSAFFALSLSACGGNARMAAAAGGEVPAESMSRSKSVSGPYTVDTPISDVLSDPVFGDYGRLIFPVNAGYYSGDTLGELHLTWYSSIDPAKTVEIANYMRVRAEAGDTIFYDIYTDEEKAADPAKEDTGLFFFKGNPGERFAICNAGGGFAYVGAMHDSFPHALELSRMGYNAFALIYRPGAQTACEDLARAIQFIFEHADELEVETDRYSLWGGSAGGRMAAYLGSYGPAAFGGGDLPRPGAVIMQYTGHSEYTENDPPTYACVGTSDGIANWRTMERRLEALEKQGIPTEFHAYEGLRHGFGLGTGTVAEGWIKDAVAFWEDQFITPGTTERRGFLQDNVLHAGTQGLTEEQIEELLVLDVRPQSFFTQKGFRDQHAGGQAFAHEEEVMRWLFGKTRRTVWSGTIPEELEYIPEGYQQPAQHPGTLEKLEYQTWESLSYEEHSQRLAKTAWVYLPYGYSADQPYNILYLSHGGWSNEETLMGTPDDPHAFKHIVDHAIEDGKIRPLIIVLPTYNNTSPSDSGNYSLALRLTGHFHNELVNDLIPAAESKYSTYAESTDLEGLAASRDHRAFGGFSMGSMNTWRTFEHCLDYFRYFAPSSGGPIGDGAYMANIVRDSGHSASDFFIFTASGTEDFAYSGFKNGVMAMGETDVFTLAGSEQEGNLSFREREGYAHDGNAANEYMYNALRFFWNGDAA